MASLRASLLLAAALCALAASGADASRDLRPLRAGFVVRGRVWCDTCRAGFETPAFTYIAGATPPFLLVRPPLLLIWSLNEEK